MLTLICRELCWFGLCRRHCAVECVSQRGVSQAHRRFSVYSINLWWINGFSLEGNKAKIGVIIIYFLYRNLNILIAQQGRGTQPCWFGFLPYRVRRMWYSSNHLLLCIRDFHLSQILKVKWTSQDGINHTSRACFLVVDVVIGFRSMSATPAVKEWCMRKRQVEESQLLTTLQI